MEKRAKCFSPVLLVIILTLGQISCIDPYEYEPDFPELIEPPPAPVLTHPASGAIFSSAVPCAVILEWQSIPGAEYYNIKIFYIQNDTTSMNNINNIQTSSYIFNAAEYRTYYWQVCADSRYWKWYTEWSETFSFTIVNE